MTKKRFIEFMTQNSDDGELNCGFTDIAKNEWYHTKDRTNAKKCIDLLNKQEDLIRAKNKQLEDVKRILKENDAIKCLRQLGWDE